MAAQLATIENYQEKIGFRLARIHEQWQREANEILSQARQHGAKGSRIGVQYCEAAKKSLQEAAEAAFGEEVRVIGSSAFIEEEEAEAATEATLQIFLEQLHVALREMVLKETSRPEDGERIVDAANLHGLLEYYIRMGRSGLLEDAPARPIGEHRNTISIGTVIGSAIQQGTRHSHQRVENHVDLQAVAKAADQLASEIASVPVPAPELASIATDVHYLREQLKKPSPPLSLLKSIGGSLQSVAENAAGNALTPGVLAGIAAIMAALGLGG